MLREFRKSNSQGADTKTKFRNAAFCLKKVPKMYKRSIRKTKGITNIFAVMTFSKDIK